MANISSFFTLLTSSVSIFLTCCFFNQSNIEINGTADIDHREEEVNNGTFSKKFETMKTPILLLIFALFCFSKTIFAESEPNDSIAIANEITADGGAGVIVGKIGKIGDKDYFFFVVDRTSLLTIKATDIPAELKPKLVLYNENLEVLDSFESENNEEIILRHLACNPGKYFLLFKDKEDARHNGDDFYQIGIQFGTDADPNECNNNQANATYLELDQEIEGAIQNKGDIDWYGFKVPRAGIINVELTNIPAVVLPNLVLIKPNSEVTMLDGNATDKSLSITEFTCNQGIFYVKFQDQLNSSESLEKYKLKVVLDTTDIYECNNTINTPAAIPLEQELIATIQNRGDSDYYAFDISKPGLINIGIKNIATNLTPMVELYDINKNLIKSISGTKGDHLISIDHFTCTPGRYYFLFKNSDNVEWNKQPYHFMVKNMELDAHECNDSIPTATNVVLAEKITGAIQIVGDKDYYGVNLTKGLFDVTLSKIPLEIRPKIEIADQTGAILATQVTDSISDSTILKYLICTDGIYYVIISDATNRNYSYEPYELFLTSNLVDVHECNNSRETATKLKVGESLQAYIDVVGDEDFYEFESPGLGSAIRATFTNLPNTIRPSVQAFNTQGVLLGSAEGPQGTPEINLEFAICEENPYYFVFKDADGTRADNKNPYTLTLFHEQLDSFECNNQFITATNLTLNVAVRANIKPANDLDHYKFSLQQNTPYDLIVNLIPDSINLVASIYANGATEPMLVQKATEDSLLVNLNVPTSGDYFLRLEDEGHDNANTSSYYLLIRENTNGIGDISMPRNNLVVFPNPANETITVKGIKRGNKIEILDFTGKTVIQSSQNKIDVSQLNKGFYFIKTELGTARFVKD